MRVNGKRHIYNTLSSYEYGVDVQLAASSHGASKAKPIMTSACYRYTAIYLQIMSGTVEDGEAKI